MLGQIVLLAAVVVAVVGVLALAFVMSFRTKFRPVLNAVRRMNRRFTNPRQLRTAGHVGTAVSVVHHVGRTSGKPYRTPVTPAATADGLVFALPYGPRADWVRNVMAAGQASIERAGETVRVDQPRLITRAEGNPYFPPQDQRTHRRFGVDDFLVMTRTAEKEVVQPSSAAATA